MVFFFLAGCFISVTANVVSLLGYLDTYAGVLGSSQYYDNSSS